MWRWWVGDWFGGMGVLEGYYRLCVVERFLEGRGEFESVVELVDGDEGSESFACFFGRGRLGDGTFVIEFGYICCQDTYPMYRACIVHVGYVGGYVGGRLRGRLRYIRMQECHIALHHFQERQPPRCATANDTLATGSHNHGIAAIQRSSTGTCTSRLTS